MLLTPVYFKGNITATISGFELGICFIVNIRIEDYQLGHAPLL